MYTKMLDKTAIIELNIETQSCKIKVGQNLNEERKNKFLEKLKNRNSQIDNETIKVMEIYKK